MTKDEILFLFLKNQPHHCPEQYGWKESAHDPICLDMLEGITLLFKGWEVTTVDTSKPRQEDVYRVCKFVNQQNGQMFFVKFTGVLTSDGFVFKEFHETHLIQKVIEDWL